MLLILEKKKTHLDGLNLKIAVDLRCKETSNQTGNSQTNNEKIQKIK